MYKQKILSGLALLAVIFVFNGCSDLSNVTYLKLGHGLDISHPVHKGMVYMAERLAEKSGGTLQMEIYPSQQLGTERQCLELLQIGSLAMTKVSGSVMESFAPNIQVFSLPYIFRDREHIYKVMDGEVGKSLLAEGEQFWLRGLAYFDAGQRSFYTKDRPINSPDDLAGLKIRVQESPTSMEMVRKLGASPTPISFGELYTALQQGVVDGAENNPPSFYTSRHYEVCKFYSLNEHTAVPDILLISTIFWNRLSDQEKIWLQEAADEAVVYQRKIWAEDEKIALDAVKAAGVEIIYPDKGPFAEKTKSMFDAYKDNPEIYNIIQRIQAVQ